MNRNFPSAWRLEGEQYGAGPFPTSEPEIHAAVSAICARPNICGAVHSTRFPAFTYGRLAGCRTTTCPRRTSGRTRRSAKRARDMTGYPRSATIHEFKYHPKEVITGVFDDWMYEHRGVYSWTTEIWSPQRQAGITDYKYIDWYREHPFDDDLKMLAWSDTELDGKGYVDWYPFTPSPAGRRRARGVGLALCVPRTRR